MSEYVVITSDFLNLTITNSGNNTRCVERRFQKGITVNSFKEKLELLTGGNPSTMALSVYDKSDRLVCVLDGPERLLGSYPIDEGMRVHVVDSFASHSEDLSEVPKFELSEDEYAKRSDTVKAFLEKNKLGKYNEEETKRKEEERLREMEEEAAFARLCKIGDRCEVDVPNQPKRRATIKYVGEADFKPGWWIGVEYDEPLGKNNGTVGGKKYFECLPKYGGFVKPAHVKVGDFPEEDYELDEEL